MRHDNWIVRSKRLRWHLLHTPKHFTVCLLWNNRCKLLLRFYRRNYRDSVGAKDGSWVFTRKRDTHTPPILWHWTWPRAWNFLIYSCNLCFWSLLTLRGRCHWSNVAAAACFAVWWYIILHGASNRMFSSKHFAMSRIEKGKNHDLVSAIFQMILTLSNKIFLYVLHFIREHVISSMNPYVLLFASVI